MHRLERELRALAKSARRNGDISSIKEKIIALADESHWYETHDLKSQSPTERIQAGRSVDFAVFESRWNKYSNITVKPVFDVITQGELRNRPDTITYERFLSEASFADGVRFVRTNTEVQVIYIATHGSQEDIGSANKDSINIELLNSLLSKPGVDGIIGLYFGACLFCSEENAKELLRNNRNLTWIGGFGRSVPWSESTFFDGLFFLQYTKSSRICKLKTNRRRPILRQVAEKIKILHGGIISYLDFHMYIKEEDGTVKDSMKDANNYITDKTLAELEEMKLAEDTEEPGA